MTKLAACTDFKERQNIRGALRELKGLKLDGDTVITYSFGQNSLKRTASLVSLKSEIGKVFPKQTNYKSVDENSFLERKYNNRTGDSSQTDRLSKGSLVRQEKGFNTDYVLDSVENYQNSSTRSRNKRIWKEVEKCVINTDACEGKNDGIVGDRSAKTQARSKRVGNEKTDREEIENEINAINGYTSDVYRNHSVQNREDFVFKKSFGESSRSISSVKEILSESFMNQVNEIRSTFERHQEEKKLNFRSYLYAGNIGTPTKQIEDSCVSPIPTCHSVSNDITNNQSDTKESVIKQPESLVVIETVNNNDASLSSTSPYLNQAQRKPRRISYRTSPFSPLQQSSQLKPVSTSASCRRLKKDSTSDEVTSDPIRRAPVQSKDTVRTLTGTKIVFKRLNSQSDTDQSGRYSVPIFSGEQSGKQNGTLVYSQQLKINQTDSQFDHIDGNLRCMDGHSELSQRTEKLDGETNQETTVHDKSDCHLDGSVMRADTGRRHTSDSVVYKSKINNDSLERFRSKSQGCYMIIDDNDMEASVHKKRTGVSRKKRVDSLDGTKSVQKYRRKDRPEVGSPVSPHPPHSDIVISPVKHVSVESDISTHTDIVISPVKHVSVESDISPQGHVESKITNGKVSHTHYAKPVFVKPNMAKLEPKHITSVLDEKHHTKLETPYGKCVIQESNHTKHNTHYTKPIRKSSHVRRKLPEIPVSKHDNDNENDETVHERTMRLLQERRKGRLGKIIKEKEVDINCQSPKLKATPEQIKNHLQEKLEHSDSKRKACRVRRELQLLNRETKLKCPVPINLEAELSAIVKAGETVTEKENVQYPVRISQFDISMKPDEIEMDLSCSEPTKEIERPMSAAAREVGLLLSQSLITPDKKIDLIGCLMQEEAKLQEQLRRSTSFTDKRKMRAEVRELREKRNALEGASLPAPTLQRSASVSSGVITHASTPDGNKVTQHDFISRKPNIDELRRQLSETTDYDEKRKIRLALRQLRQQTKDGNPIQAGLQRSQSFIHQKPSETAVKSETQSENISLFRSHSVSDPNVPQKEEFGSQILNLQKVTEKHRISVCKKDNLVTSDTDHSDPRISDFSKKSGNYHSKVADKPPKHSVFGNGDSNVKPIEAGCLPPRAPRRHSFAFGTEPKLRNQTNTLYIDITQDTYSEDAVDNKTGTSISESTITQTVHPKLQTGVTDNQENGQPKEIKFKSKFANILISGGTIDRKRSPFDLLSETKTRESARFISSQDKSKSCISSQGNKPEIRSETTSVTDNRCRAHKSLENLCVKTDIDSDNRLTPNIEWLEGKKRTIPTPNELDKLMSSMDIEAAFSQILDAVETAPTKGEIVDTQVSDTPIMEEESESSTSSVIELTNIAETKSTTDSVLKKDIKNVDNHKVIVNELVKTNFDNDIVKTSDEEKLTDTPSEVEDTIVQKQSDEIMSSVKQNGDLNNDSDAGNSSGAIPDAGNKVKSEKTIQLCSNLSLNVCKQPETSSAISVIHGDDGSVTVKEVNRMEEGDTITTEWKKVSRSNSKSEIRETDTVVEKRITSPGGNCHVYEKGVSKTKRKLTSRGSEYFSRNHYNIRKRKDLEGMEIVEHELDSESANMSVSNNESWGERSEAKVILNRDINTEIKSKRLSITKKDTDVRPVTANSVEKEASSNQVQRSNSGAKVSSGYGSLSQSDEGHDLEAVVEAHLGRPSGCPEIISPLSLSVTAIEGSTAVLEFEFKGHPVPTLTWYKGDTVVEENKAVKVKVTLNDLLVKGRLEIQEVTSEDSGDYKCVVRNFVGSASTTGSLNVKYETATLPWFQTQLHDVTAMEGQSVTLECQVSHADTVMWFKDGIIQRNSPDLRQSFDRKIAKLDIIELYLDDDGTYSCVISNKAGENGCSCRITVQETKDSIVPMFLRKLDTQICDVGDTTIFETEVIGSPEPTVTWFGNLNQLIDSDCHKMEYDGRIARLVLRKVALCQGGKVECVAENSSGRVSCDCVLVVQDESDESPKPETCKVAADEFKSDEPPISSLPSSFTPKVNNGRIHQAKSNASKVMLVRQASLRSVYKNNQPADVKRAGSFHASTSKSYGTVKKISEDRQFGHKLETVVITPKPVIVGNVENTTDTETASSVVAVKGKDSDKKQVLGASAQVSMQSETVNRGNSIIETRKPDEGKRPNKVDHNENYTKDVNSNISKTASGEIKKTIKLEFQIDSSNPATNPVTQTVSQSDTEKVTSDKRNSVCKADMTPVSRIKAGSYLRRTQSTKTQGSEKPEWLQVKLRKVTNTPLSNTEKQSIEKNPNYTSLRGAVTTEPLSSTPVSVHREVQLSRSQSARVVDRKTSPVLKDSTNSPSNDSAKQSVKLTPVSERAKLFLANEGKSLSVKSSPMDIIAKAINLSRTESMKSPAGQRPFLMQRSASFKTETKSSHLGDITLNLSPQESQGEDKSGVSSSPPRKPIRVWDPSAPSTTKMDHSKINDEEELNKLLNDCENFEERKKIRSRIKELRDIQMKEWDAKKEEREKNREDVIKAKHRDADADKQRRMKAFDEQAKQSYAPKHLEVAEQNLKDKYKQADLDKQRKLEAFDRLAGKDVKQSSTVKTEVSTDGKTTTTTRKVETTTTVTGRGATGRPAEEVAPQMLRHIINTTSPSVSGQLSVRSESWSSKDGVTRKSEKTESWGGKPVNPFKAADAANPKTNPLVAYTFAKKAATTMKRNAVAIKQEVLYFCQRNTAEYEKIEITNFSTSWNDGIAFCALIHHFYPEAFDFYALEPKQRRKNFELAFDTAEKYADIAPLLDVEDMVRMKKPDWKCVFTYVQSFYRKLKDHDMNKVKAVES